MMFDDGYDGAHPLLASPTINAILPPLAMTEAHSADSIATWTWHTLAAIIHQEHSAPTCFCVSGSG
jgi:hypothetical protein